MRRVRWYNARMENNTTHTAEAVARRALQLARNELARTTYDTPEWAAAMDAVSRAVRVHAEARRDARRAA